MKRSVFLVLFLLGGMLHAEISLAPLFRDGAVLQRGKPVPVWGSAAPGERITVTFSGHSVSTIARSDGTWRADLPALAATAEPATLTVQGDTTEVVQDVVVGEVWLASGQSNMERRVDATHDARLEALAADYPFIRHFKVLRRVAESPVANVGGKWVPCTSRTVGDFTAVGYFFAVDLYRALKVPVGIINSSRGGTYIQPWMDGDSLRSERGPSFAAVHARWAETLVKYPSAKAAYDKARGAWEAERDAAKSAGGLFTKQAPYPPPGPGGETTPSGLYNGMIHPLIPYALRGVIWYQGESNVGRAAEYREYFPALITGWRACFGQGDFPFYWVQLANYRGKDPSQTAFALLREAQTEALALPKTGQAVTIDIGNAGDIHPRNKRDVGRRLALLALTRDYGQDDWIDSGPFFSAATREGATMRVTFAVSKSPLASPLAEHPPGFELAGEDKVFYPAQAMIEGATVRVESERVPSPVAVRYAWANAPIAGLFNQDGLPAAPFRSDRW